MKNITELAPLVTDKRPDGPEDLAACVMRSLEKDPDDRWPTADALRRALEARSATLYKPRRSSAKAALPSRSTRLPLPPPAPAQARWELARTLRPAERARERPALAPSGEPLIVLELRRRFVTWASVCGSLFVIDVAANHRPGFSLIVAAVWAGWKLVPRYVRLWNAGYSWRDVLARPPAPDAIEARLAARGRRPGAVPQAANRQVRREAEAAPPAPPDRQAIPR